MTYYLITTRMPNVELGQHFFDRFSVQSAHEGCDFVYGRAFWWDYYFIRRANESIHHCDQLVRSSVVDYVAKLQDIGPSFGLIDRRVPWFG